MPHACKALTLVWLFVLALVAVSASGSVSSRGVVLLALVALGTPLLLITFPKPRHVRARMARPHSPASTDEVRRWENEGGA